MYTGVMEAVNHWMEAVIHKYFQDFSTSGNYPHLSIELFTWIFFDILCFYRFLSAHQLLLVYKKLEQLKIEELWQSVTGADPGFGNGGGGQDL